MSKHIFLLKMQQDKPQSNKKLVYNYNMKTILKMIESNKEIKNEKELWVLLDTLKKNINSLVKESKILLDNGYYSRSFFLSYCALEELGKRLIVCDYITGILSKTEFDSAFRDHAMKIAYLHNNCQLLKNDDSSLEATIVYDKDKFKSWLKERNKALYVGFNQLIIDPLKEVTSEDAQNIFAYLLKSIDDTNYYETVNERIGSKAFYK